jgi:hypothetical protein
MTNVDPNGTTAQLPPLTTKTDADFNEAIRNARVALNGSLYAAIFHLSEASRLAAEIKNPHAHELANLVGALEPVFETLQLVELRFLDKFPGQ